MMIVSRWKLMACMLGLSLGGLAYVTNQSNNKLNAQANGLAPERPSPVPTEPPPIIPPVAGKPIPAPTGAETLPPLSIPLPPVQEIELVVPKIAPVSGNAIPVPTAPLIAIEQELIPEPVSPIPETLPKPRPIAAPALRAVPVFDDAPPVFNSPPAFPVATPPVVLAPVPSVPAAPPVSPFLAPKGDPLLSQPQPAPVAPTSKLKMTLRLGDGKPRFEIRTKSGEELLLKVYGETVEMQAAPHAVKNSPIAGVTATGKVRFTGPGIEGTCDQLAILSGTGEVLLKGNIHLKTKRGKTWSEMTADKMIYQIGASGLSAEPNRGTAPVSHTDY